MTKPIFQTPYILHQRVSHVNRGPSRTKQSFKNECDIQNILQQFVKTGLVTHISSRAPHYADYIGVPEFQEAQNSIAAAQTAFDSLPSHIRRRFGNDPSQFLEFVHNPDNSQEIIKMGLGPSKLPLETAIDEAALKEPAPSPKSSPKVSKEPTTAPETS
nr:MAG: internal scaffolding protein [Microvirus sp.]